jgi:hypothetical protein
MPRVTKAQLQERVDNLEGANAFLRERAGQLVKENDELKKRVSRGHDRSRSPRMPAASSQANVDMTCKALSQVSLWQHDTVVEEQRAEIQRLQAEVAQKDETIESLLRGEGPLGPVLAHAYRTKMARYNVPPSEVVLEEVSVRTGPVYDHFLTISDALRDVADYARIGRCYTRPTQLPY